MLSCITVQVNPHLHDPHAHSNIVHRWDFVTILTLFYLMFSLPLRLGFELAPSGFGLWLERTVDLFFILDILINFRSHYVDVMGHEVKDPKMVAKNYLKTWFAIDFVSSIPFDWFLTALGSTKALKSTKMIKAARVVKIIKLSKFSQNTWTKVVEDWFAMNRFGLQLLKLLATAFLLAHFMSCGISLVQGQCMNP